MRFFYSIALLLCVLVVQGQETYTISGYVNDGFSGEYLIGANVYEREGLVGTTTNTYGFFSLTLPEGEYELVASFVGFEDYTEKIVLNANMSRTIELSSKAVMTKEVVVRAEKKNNIESTSMSTTKLEVSQVKELPAVFGEVDILKTIQLLPGVQSAGEGNAGFYVRGGGPDQNLILLDEAVVYNASHLFGFFSVFNADAIKNVELIKGGMPANYGGRLASVLDISMNEGNMKKFSGSGGIGLISSRLTLEGPIKKDESSFIISGRRTYIDVLTKPAIKDTDFDGTSYFFYDLNAKINWKASPKDRLYLSGYFGKDKFSFKLPDADIAFAIPWGNKTASLRWNHLFSDKLFMNLTSTFTQYDFDFQAGFDDFSFSLLSGIRDWTGKVDFSLFPSPRHRIKFGANAVSHRYTPTFAEIEVGDTEFDTGTKTFIFADELSLYAMDDFDLTDDFKINVGLRMPYFVQKGPFVRYEPDVRSPDTLRTYADGERVVDYFGLEPRLSMRYALDKTSSVKAAFTRNLQFVHLASFSPLGLPTDLWIPSSSRVKPQIGLQYNLGYFKNFMDDTYEASVEVYYKTMDNQIEYAEGEQPQNGALNNVDNQLVFGDGYSYGVELFLKRRVGELTGWVGYTLSKTMRQFPDVLNGEEFPARYDRRHDLSIVGSYDYNPKWTFAASYVYGTGSAITLPESWYFTPSEGRVEFEYGPRNSSRMRSFHRFDISATLNVSPIKYKKDRTTGEKVEIPRKWESYWTFGIYNVYNRANPFFYYIDILGVPGQGDFDFDLKQVSLFPVLPSVSWNFKF